MANEIHRKKKQSSSFNDDEEEFFQRGNQQGKRNLFDLEYQEEDFDSPDVIDFEAETMPIDSGQDYNEDDSYEDYADDESQYDDEFSDEEVFDEESYYADDYEENIEESEEEFYEDELSESVEYYSEEGSAEEEFYSEDEIFSEEDPYDDLPEDSPSEEFPALSHFMFRRSDGGVETEKMIQVLNNEAQLLSGKLASGMYAEAARLAYVWLDNMDMSSKLYRRAVKEWPLDEFHLQRYIEVELQQQQHTMLSELFTKLASKKSGAEAATIYLDQAAVESNLDHAIAALQRATDEMPNDWFILYVLLNKLRQKEDWAGVLMILTRFADLSHKEYSAHFHVQRAKICTQYLAREDEAIAALYDALQADPKHFTARIALLRSLKGRDKELFALYEKWAKQEDLWKYNALIVGLRTGDLRAKMVESITSSQDAGFSWVKFFMLEKSRKWRQCKEILIDYVEHCPPQELALCWWKLGVLYSGPLQDHEAAKDAFHKVLDIDLMAFCAVEALCDIWVDDDQYQTAIQFLLRLAGKIHQKDAPTAVMYLTWAAMIAGIHADDPHKAVQLLQSSQDARTTRLYEIFLIGAREWRDLVRYYTAAIKHEDERAEISRYELSLLHAHQFDDHQSACQVLDSIENLSGAQVIQQSKLRNYIKAKNWSKVVELLRHDVNSQSASWAASMILSQLDEPGEGLVDTLTRYLAGNPDDFIGRIMLRKAYIRSGDIENAADLSLQLSRDLPASLADWTLFSLTHRLGDEHDQLASKIVAGCTELPNAVAMGIMGAQKNFSAADVMHFLTSQGDAGEYKESTFELVEALDEQDQDVISQRLEAMTFEKGDALALSIQLLASNMPQLAEDILSEQPQLLKEYASALETTKSAESIEVWEQLFQDESDDIVVALGVQRMASNKGTEQYILSHQQLGRRSSAKAPRAHHAYLAGYLWEKQGATKEALQNYRMAYQCAQGYNRYFKALEFYYIQQNNLEDVLELYAGTNCLEHRYVAEKMELLGNYKQAAKSYKQLLMERQALDDSPAELSLLYLKLEHCYEKSGNWSEVAHFIEQRLRVWQEQEHRDAMRNKLMWIMVEHLPNTDQALELYKRLHEEFPHDKQIIEALARISAEHGDVEGAVLHLRQLVVQAVDDTEASRYQRRIAEAYLSNDDLDNARYELHEALDMNFQDTESQELLKSIYRQEEDWPALVGWLLRLVAQVKGAARLPVFKDIALIYEEKLLNMDRAAENWQKILRESPENQEALQHLVSLSKERLAYQEMMQYANRLLTLLEGPAKGELLVDLAETSQQLMDDPIRAKEYLQEAVLYSPNSKKALGMLLENNRESNNPDELINILLQLSHTETEDQMKLKHLLEALELQLEYFDDSVLERDICAQIVAIDANHYQSLQILADIEFANQNYESAVEYFTSIEANFFHQVPSQDKVSFLFDFATILQHLQRPDEALQRYKKVLHFDPEHFPTLQAAAPLLLEKEEWELASKVHRSLLKIGSFKGDSLAEVYGAMAHIEHHLQRFSVAAKCYMRALNIRVNDVQLLLGLGSVLFDLGDWNKTIKVFQRVLESVESQAEDRIYGLLVKAFVLDKKMNMSKKAEQHYKLSLDFDEQQPVIWLRLAELAMRKQNWKKVSAFVIKGLSVSAEEDEIKALLLLMLSLVSAVNKSAEQAQKLYGDAADLMPELDHELGQNASISEIQQFLLMRLDAFLQ